IESVLDSRFGHLFHRDQQLERSFLVFGLAESTATPLMEAIEDAFPGIKVFSLPSMGEDGVRRHIELGVKGLQDRIDEAFARLEAGVRELGGEVRR
ncbi:MAG TPA: competence/damage-inducible protein A, partial [Zeimonas sp.]|nr:competence/damage-inducible protein A [Zeimonas sp.]